MTPVTPAELSEQAPGIFYGTRSLVLIDRTLVEFLKQAACRTPTLRARVCAHPSAEAEQHNMLIASARGTYVAPHRHRRKSETFLVLEGQADMLLFDNDGRLTDLVPMGPAASGRAFFYLMPEGQYHSLIIDSDVLVFVESTKGPFRPEDTENASWAPAVNAAAEGSAFLASATAERRAVQQARRRSC
ncbi:MAG: WbuC family cupin fold metalloprotein [Pseudolabrys sp.]|nr:WbuC family cupin fold metalloprotein [Pseudolabrys sp.]MDP2295748.1 WbuC family cupin fold metalloprotein [Pseudolabrys sp.]